MQAGQKFFLFILSYSIGFFCNVQVDCINFSDSSQGLDHPNNRFRDETLHKLIQFDLFAVDFQFNLSGSLVIGLTRHYFAPLIRITVSDACRFETLLTIFKSYHPPNVPQYVGSFLQLTFYLCLSRCAVSIAYPSSASRTTAEMCLRSGGSIQVCWWAASNSPPPPM